VELAELMQGSTEVDLVEGTGTAVELGSVGRKRNVAVEAG